MDGMAGGGRLRAELAAVPAKDSVLLRSVRVSLKGSSRRSAALRDGKDASVPPTHALGPLLPVEALAAAQCGFPRLAGQTCSSEIDRAMSLMRTEQTLTAPWFRLGCLKQPPAITSFQNDGGKTLRIGPAMTLTLYSKFRNSAGERVRIGLALKGVNYDYVPVGSGGQIGWDAYAEINPQRLMPALKINETVVPQATAILEYIEEVFPEPRLLPLDPVARAQARGFAQHITSEMHAVDVIRVRRFLHNELEVDESGLAHWQRHWMTKGLTALEQCLSRREKNWTFCFGQTPGWADIHLVPQVRKGLSRFGLDLSPYPLISGIFETCVSLPAFIEASPQNQVDYPKLPTEPT